MGRNIIIFLFAAFILGESKTTTAQVIVNPVVESKTHPSLTIDSIYLTNESTTCYLSVVNQNTEGNAWFCADANIDIVDIKSGIKRPLLSSLGIPVCPDAYRFKEFGEKLSFVLNFGPLHNTNAEIDIIENCSDNCFSLKGIVLDQKLNKEIRAFEKGLVLYKEEKLEEALGVFEKIKRESDYKKENHVAYCYYILPLMYRDMEKYDLARKAYNDLLESQIKDKNYFIQRLNGEDFNWNKP